MFQAFVHGSIEVLEGLAVVIVVSVVLFASLTQNYTVSTPFPVIRIWQVSAMLINSHSYTSCRCWPV